MNAFLMRAMLALAAAVMLAGCGTRELDDAKVRAFVDQADAATNKRFAPTICELRGASFTHKKMHRGAYDQTPREISMSRALYCREMAKLAKLYQFVREREAMTVEIAPDRRSAVIKARYVEKLPYYEEGVMPASPDMCYEFQVLDIDEESRISVENGDIVHLATSADVTQTLVPKAEMPLPYD
jgi:hypothetical protein